MVCGGWSPREGQLSRACSFARLKLVKSFWAPTQEADRFWQIVIGDQRDQRLRATEKSVALFVFVALLFRHHFPAPGRIGSLNPALIQFGELSLNGRESALRKYGKFEGISLVRADWNV